MTINIKRICLYLMLIRIIENLKALPSETKILIYWKIWFIIRIKIMLIVWNIELVNKD
jgi:hypothetical protein